MISVFIKFQNYNYSQSREITKAPIINIRRKKLCSVMIGSRVININIFKYQTAFILRLSGALLLLRVCLLATFISLFRCNGFSLSRYLSCFKTLALIFCPVDVQWITLHSMHFDLLLKPYNVLQKLFGISKNETNCLEIYITYVDAFSLISSPENRRFQSFQFQKAYAEIS